MDHKLTNGKIIITNKHNSIEICILHIYNKINNIFRVQINNNIPIRFHKMVLECPRAPYTIKNQIKEVDGIG